MTYQPERKWITASIDSALAAAIARRHGMSKAVSQMLAARGFADAEELEKFLQPKLADLADPFQLPDMEKAVRLILDCIERNVPILIYGDYDVDGVTSTALLVQVLSRMGGQVAPFLPHRIEDGYGLGVDTLNRCIDFFRPGLIVTVDCGTSSVDAVRKAREQGIEVIVTDHHEPADQVAEAAAIVNPKLGGPENVRMLAGVGVAFKLSHALIKEARHRQIAAAHTIDLRQYMDLVAVGTIADIVPLLRENRILAYHGLALLNQTKSIGLRSLINVAGIRGRIDAYHIGFLVGPRINAAGRLGNAQAALELILTEHLPRAQSLAMQLDASNRERQEIEDRIVRDACAGLEDHFDPTRDYGLVVSKEGWHAGVIGIVASRLAARFNRPVVVIGIGADGIGRGSCRSIENFNLLQHLSGCADLLIRYGGHSMAAGLEVEQAKIPAFRERFNELSAATLRAGDLRRQLAVDAWIGLDEVNEQLCADQDRLKPFGHANPMPVWAVRGARVVNGPRVVGTKHLRMTIAANGTQRDAIGFGMAERNWPPGLVDLAFHATRNQYNDEEFIQLQIQDVRPAAP